MLLRMSWEGRGEGMVEDCRSKYLRAVAGGFYTARGVVDERKAVVTTALRDELRGLSTWACARTGSDRRRVGALR